jgi:SAM-dependent methyltransferase
MPSSTYASHRNFPVQDYDGRHIPLEERSVDAVFSSNVLEHVEDISTILSEFRRVLRPGGIGLHVMPTTAWRFWTFLTAITDAAMTALSLPLHLASPPAGMNRAQALNADARRIAGGLIPRGHGTSPEGISELWTFSAQSWRRTFVKHGFEVIEDKPLGMLYTGTELIGDKISIHFRQKLSIFGSATHFYLTRSCGQFSRATASHV